MKTLLAILLSIGLAIYAFNPPVLGVEFLNDSNFKNKISKGIVVVEYWAEWNKSNEFTELESLKDCSVYRACIAKCKDAAADYKIKAVPTVVIYDNGEEVERFTPNIMLQLEADKKEVQSTIDEIVLNKFQ